MLASALSLCYGGFVGAPCSEPNAEAKTVGAWDVLQRCGRRKWIDKTDKEKGKWQEWWDPRPPASPLAVAMAAMLLIGLPLAMPGVAVSAILSFIFSWNELLFAYILAPKDAKTAPAMAVTFMEGYDVPYGKIMATSTLIVIPVLIFALLASRHLVRGLTMGAVK